MTVSTASPTAAWAARAPELAQWAWDRMVIRTDVWGGYNPLADRGRKYLGRDGKECVVGKTQTMPWKKQRGRVSLTPAVLERHFRARVPEHVIGLHTTGPDNTSKFGTVEVDVHGEGGNDPAATRRATLAWYEVLGGRGFRPLLWDSNGEGGYHLDIYFVNPVSTPNLFWYLRDLVADHQRYGLPARPETFPKQARINRNGKCPCGNWVRVVGRHHTTDHWASVYDGAGGWLSGAEAVAFVLGVPASPAGLIPADYEIRSRIATYLATLPHLGEGQGRDDVAFTLLAFLARDLSLSDEDALRYAAEWDRGNTPPKGDERLREVLANVHRYGQREYGSGLNGDHRGNTPLPGERNAQLRSGDHSHDRGATTGGGVAPLPPERSAQQAWEIIRDHFRTRYRPGFKVGDAIHSGTELREVRRVEACAALPPDLIGPLSNASNVPRVPPVTGQVKVEALPGFFRKWAGTAWAALLDGLPDEDSAERGTAAAELAADEFRRLVRDALLAEVVIGDVIGKDGVTQTERRSLIDWCLKFAKPGPWRSVRSKRCWCKMRVLPGGEIVLMVAIRHDLFAQMHADRRLCEMGPKKFARRAARYGVGRSSQDDRPHGHVAILLDPAFLAELTEACPDVADEADERPEG